MDALSRLGVFIHAEEKDVASSRSGGQDHSFAGTKLHPAGRQIRGDDDQPANQLVRLIRLLYSGEDRACFIPPRFTVIFNNLPA